MYFPTSVASQLCTVPSLPNDPDESILSICASSRKSLFCAITRSGIAVWRVRPSALVAYLSRTPTSISDHGENQAVWWSPDGTRIVVQTTGSYLVLVSVKYSSKSKPYDPPLASTSNQRNFLPGPGEAQPLHSLLLDFEGVIRVDGTLSSVSPRKHYILFSTKNPPSVQRVPWPTGDAPPGSGAPVHHRYNSWSINGDDFPWLVDTEVYIRTISWTRGNDVESWITSDGRAYFVQLAESAYSDVNASSQEIVDGQGAVVNDSKTSIDSALSQPSSQWQGTCIHNVETPRWVQKRREVEPGQDPSDYVLPRRAVKVAVNGRFSLIAIGTHSGCVELTNFPSPGGVVPKPQTLEIPQSYSTKPRGPVCAMEWSSDAYVLAVGWRHGWAVWSVAGRCLAWSFGYEDQVDQDKFQDSFMNGIRELFWAPGDFELMALAHSSPNKPEGQMFAIPFAKSATTGQHTPDNSEYAFLQMDDRVLVYRGSDQPDMSVINPESDVWQHIKIPQRYLAGNWPVRYSSISADGRLIAVAGRRGLIHYSSTSGRWKVFADEQQEQAFAVRGGLLWFHHVLIVAVEVAKSWQIRLFSRDLELSNQNILHRELLSSPVVILSLVDNSLLVYTADNTLSHYLIVPTDDSIKLHFCGNITFDGVIAHPNAVRVLSWMIPTAQKQFGDPTDDMTSATVLMMVGGQLVLLRPRKSASQEVSYDMQILANRIEFCWIHLRGIGSLENSLWGFDGQGMRVWLNALTMDTSAVGLPSEPREDVKESVNIPLDFYPLSVLMNKGIIIGAEHETTARTNLSFVTFRHATSSHLFLHHILRFHLAAERVQEAVSFASHYQDLVFFAHALEILLHTVVESEASTDDEAFDTLPSVLPAVVDFLDHFDVALDVVVGCARKTEMTRWRRLFEIIGDPRSLFEACLATGRLRTAGSYLLVLHSLEQLQADNDDTMRLLRRAVEAEDWQFSRELLRFLHSIDGSGAALNEALLQPFMLESSA